MSRRHVGRHYDKLTKWGDSRANFKSFQLFGEIASNYIRENHPLFLVDGPLYQGSGNLSTRSSTEVLSNNSDAPRIISKRGRPKKSDSSEALDTGLSLNKKRKQDYPELVLDENSRSRRNVGPPKHFENMIMMEGSTGRRRDRRDKEDGEDYPEVTEGRADVSQASSMGPPNKRNRRGDNKTDSDKPQRYSRKPSDIYLGHASERDGVGTSSHATNEGRPSIYPPPPHGHTNHAPQQAYPHSYHNHLPGQGQGPHNTNVGGRVVNPLPAQVQGENKKASFEQFLEQLREFFSMIGAWYGVSGPIVLHYLREQILPVLRVLSASPVSKDTANNLIYQISRSISNPLICVLFLKLIAIGRGFPLYSAIVHTVKRYDPENLYGLKSMHFFVEPPPVDVFNIYLRKVVEALNGPAGPEVFRQVAGLMEEIVVEWKNYDITLEKRLEKIAQIDRLLPENMRGLRARLYHVLFMPTTIMSHTLQQQQDLDEMHVITNASTMVGEEISRVLARIGLEALCDTGVVPSGIPHAILFNNVAFVKAAPVHSMHPAMNPVKGLDYDVNGHSGGNMSMNPHHNHNNSLHGSMGSAPPHGGMKNVGFPNPLSGGGGVSGVSSGVSGMNGYGMRPGGGGQPFRPAVKGPYPVAPLNRLNNNNNMPYGSSYVNNPNATAGGAQQGTHTDLTSKFLSDANTKVPTQYKQPFTDAMKKLFRCMKEQNTPQEEIDARVMLVQSFVPPEETQFRADIVRLFKRENFVNSAINTSSGSSGNGNGSGGNGGTNGGINAGRSNYMPTFAPANQTRPHFNNPNHSHNPHNAIGAPGTARVSSGVNWVAEYTPLVNTTTGTNNITKSAKAKTHVDMAINEVIDLDGEEEEEDQPEVGKSSSEDGHSSVDVSKGESNSSKGNDNVSDSNSDVDSNADEEEEGEEQEDVEKEQEQSAAVDSVAHRAPILDEVGSTSSSDDVVAIGIQGMQGMHNPSVPAVVQLPSIRELEQRALNSTTVPLGTGIPTGGSGNTASYPSTTANAHAAPGANASGYTVDPSVASRTPQLMLLSNLSNGNSTATATSTTKALSKDSVGAINNTSNMPNHNALYLQNISNPNIPNVGTGYHMSDHSGSALTGNISSSEGNGNGDSSLTNAVEEVKRKRGRPRKV